jgi:hypothetical protein
VLNACPSDALSASDADALRKVVGYLRDHGVTALTVAGDGSPRSDRAEQTVRESAARAHIRVNRLRGTDVARARNTKGALVVVAGWADAASRLYTISEEQATHPHFGAGLYLAPWLVHAPVVNSALTSFLPLRFNPRDGASVSYAITLARGFHGETPSAAGFAQWSAAHRQRPDEGDALLYACAQVNVMPMEPMAATDDGAGGAGMGGDAAGMGHDMAGMDMGRSTPSPMDMGMGGGSYPGQWITGGTIVPITGPLPAAP